jgi:hypothetical protein
VDARAAQHSERVHSPYGTLNTGEVEGDRSCSGIRSADALAHSLTRSFIHSFISSVHFVRSFAPFISPVHSVICRLIRFPLSLCFAGVPIIRAVRSVIDTERRSSPPALTPIPFAFISVNVKGGSVKNKATRSLRIDLLLTRALVHLRLIRARRRRLSRLPLLFSVAGRHVRRWGRQSPSHAVDSGSGGAVPLVCASDDRLPGSHARSEGETHH